MSNLFATHGDTSLNPKLVYGSNCMMLDHRDSQGPGALSSPSKPAEDEITHPCTSTDSSPNDHLHATRNAPTWSASQVNAFVRSSGTKDDDPFVADAPTLQSSSKGLLSLLDGILYADIQDSAGTIYPVREDRAGAPPTPGTAQAHFSPDACVFVAKYVFISMPANSTDNLCKPVADRNRPPA